MSGNQLILSLGEIFLLNRPLSYVRRTDKRKEDAGNPVKTKPSQTLLKYVSFLFAELGNKMLRQKNDGVRIFSSFLRAFVANGMS